MPFLPLYDLLCVQAANLNNLFWLKFLPFPALSQVCFPQMTQQAWLLDADTIASTSLEELLFICQEVHFLETRK